MNVVKIENQIQNWSNESKSEDDYWTRIINYLKEFQSLTGLEKYITDDAEAYWEVNCYIELLEGISEITKPDIQITDIKGRSENGIWEFNFNINGEANQIKMEDPNTDWIKEEFIDSLNSCITRHRNTKKLKMVWATSENNTDQCFDMAFLDEDTFDKLVNHSPKYAYKNH